MNKRDAKSASAVYIGIDLGTTVLKAAAFDGASGALLAESAVRLKIDTREGGIREQNAATIDKAIGRVFAGLRKAVGNRYNHIAGIGLAAQGGSGVVVDRATGEPHTPMYLWNDIRGYLEVPSIQSRKPAKYWWNLSDRAEPGAGLGRFQWLKRDRPEVFNERNIYAGAGDYVFFQLTGDWRQDAGNAVQIGCYSTRKWDLVQEPLDLVGVPLSFIPPMRKGHETRPLKQSVAKRLGLPAGIPVAGPYMDHEAGYLASLGALKAPLQCSLGTAWVGNFVLPLDRACRSPFQLIIPAPIGEGRQIVQPLLTGNVTWDWGLEAFVDGDHKKALAKVGAIFDEQLLPPDGLVALPWLARPNPIDESKFGGGSFIGMNPHTHGAHLIRALAASLCYEFKRVHAEVITSGVVDGVVLAGGASRSAAFRTLLAALLAPLPVFAMSDTDLAGARGALFPFSRKAARASAQRIAKPARTQCAQIDAGYDYYCRVIDKVYGHIEAGGPFRFAKRKDDGR